MSNFISRYGLFVVIGAIVVLIAVNGLFSSSPVVIALQVIAVTPTAQTIIRRGPYTLIRHPMYSSVLLIIWSGVLSHISLLTVVIGLGATIVSVIRIISEERFLRERYPDYAEYVKTTKAVIPYLV